MDWTRLTGRSLAITAVSLAFITYPCAASAQAKPATQPTGGTRAPVKRPSSATPAPAKPPATTPQPADQLTATTVNMSPGSGETLTIDVSRWSTDEEIKKLVDAFTENDSKPLLAALQALPTVGFVWSTSDSVGYAIRYARKVSTANGGERILFAIPRTLGPGVATWKASGQASSAESLLTVIELRLNRGAPGEGKASLAAKIVLDADKKGIELGNYATAPVLFKDVIRGERVTPAPSRPAPTRP